MKTSHLPRSKNIPSVVLIKQHFSVPKEADVREATVRELKKLFPDTTAIKGKIVGLTCPSRGIRDIAQVLSTSVSFLKPHCKEVRILTAMGTHGGGTSEGERAMASDRGVTEEAVGTRIFSNMETRYIDTVNDVEVHVSEDALTVIWLFLPTGSKSIQISIGRNRCPKVSMGWKAAGQKSLPLAHRSCAPSNNIGISQQSV